MLCNPLHGLVMDKGQYCPHLLWEQTETQTSQATRLDHSAPIFLLRGHRYPCYNLLLPQTLVIEYLAKTVGSSIFQAFTRVPFICIRGVQGNGPL